MIVALLSSISVAQAGYLDRVDLVELDSSFSSGTQQQVSEQAWWLSFGDSELDSLVRSGLDQNFALAASSSRVAVAEAQAWTALSPMLPSASVDFAHQIKPCPEIGFAICDFSIPIDPATGQPSQATPDTYSQGSLYLNAGLQVDIWGARWNSAKASRLEAAASEGDRDAQAILVSAQVANAWFDVLTAREQLRITEQQLQLNTDLLEVVQMNYEQGVGTSVDVLQQRQSLASVQTNLPTARVQVMLQEQQLAILLGQDPSQPLGLPESVLPDLPAQPNVGSPELLWETRPDLRAQAARVEAAERREKASRRAVLPTVGVNAQTGYSYQDVLEMESQQQWTVGAQVSVPLLSGGANAANLSLARAQTDAAVNGANNAYLSAVGEVESALARERAAALGLEAARVQASAAEQSYQAALAEYVNGHGNYLQMGQVLGAYYAAEIGALSAHRNLLSSRITLHQALGGAWTTTWTESTP